MTSSSQHTASDAVDRMTSLILDIVKSLVDQPDALRLEAEQDETGTTLRLYVAPDDLGKVIGKQGRTARSLRTILSAISSKSDTRLSLDIVELS